MRFTILLFFVLGAQASWFGSDQPTYQGWDTQQLSQWLEQHNIPVPSAPSQKELQDLVKSNWNAAQQYGSDSYNSAQHTFQNVKESAFESWDESTLRQFLLDQGVVAPSGPREKLVQLAKQHYREYASSLSSLSYHASTGIYGSPAYQATQSISSAIAAATNEVSRQLDDSKDYVYSTWDDNKLRSWLEQQGVLKSKQQATRDDMLRLMRENYAKTTQPVWDSWSDSYLHHWLVSHHIAPSDETPSRPSLLERMKLYYYDVTEKVWHTWSDSELRSWLVNHDLVKSDAQVNRDKLEKLVADNYAHAEDTIWSAWGDSDIRQWLIDNGHVVEEKAQGLNRDELVKLINSKYNDVSSRTVPYLVWPDARLRAYLREHGLSEDALPTSRPDLLQEARIRYTQTTNRAEAIFQKLLQLLNSGIEGVEEKLAQAYEILSGAGERAMERTKGTAGWADEKRKVKAEQAEASLSSLSAEASGEAAKHKTEL
ncbi:hypothetical protein DENSPDRAFT_845383 [Dentipellis sp. KUC8613]|nr:hypothetical protein DENSPDRAFT_845383 [Dentipellis sp. KUC8613]